MCLQASVASDLLSERRSQYRRITLQAVRHLQTPAAMHSVGSHDTRLAGCFDSVFPTSAHSFRSRSLSFFLLRVLLLLQVACRTAAALHKRSRGDCDESKARRSAYNVFRAADGRQLTLVRACWLSCLLVQLMQLGSDTRHYNEKRVFWLRLQRDTPTYLHPALPASSCRKPVLPPTSAVSLGRDRWCHVEIGCMITDMLRLASHALHIVCFMCASRAEAGGGLRRCRGALRRLSWRSTRCWRG